MAAKKQEPPQRKVQWLSGEKPSFVSLDVGESCEGVYMGAVKTQFGPGYRFRDGEGAQFILGGNRVQLDRLMEDANLDPAFGAGGPVGHYLIVERTEDVESKQGRTVAQYRLGHVFDMCPKGCTPF